MASLSNIRKRRSVLKSTSNLVGNQVTLERVLGLTATNNAMLSVDPSSGAIAYTAGCVVVILRDGKQEQITSGSKKTLTCVCYSPDGRYLVTGESGHKPAVRVYDMEDRLQVTEMVGHKFGVSCVSFSPNMRHIVSIGTQHDMGVNLWNWKTGVKVASNKISSKVNAVVFSENGSMFVTVGVRHIKFWYLEVSQSKIKNETVPLVGRAGILAEHKNNTFVDVCCGRGMKTASTYAITQSGLLCEFSGRRQLDKWVELRTSRAYCLAVGSEYVYVGCAEGLIRIFQASNLQYVVSMPKPHPLGIDVTTGLSVLSEDDTDRYADAVALSLDASSSPRLSVIYNDHSMYSWDVSNVRRIGKLSSHLFHSGAVYGLELVTSPMDSGSSFPEGSFITCSNDDTIRVWNVDPHYSLAHRRQDPLCSPELQSVVYTTKNTATLCDNSASSASGEKSADFEGRNGVRCIALSPDGRHLASGDRSGNLRIHELASRNLVTAVAAHDAEILSLEYSDFRSGYRLLASASRDRFLHIYDVSDCYTLLQTLDDHSSSIASARFAWAGGEACTPSALSLLSGGFDKSLLLRRGESSPLPAPAADSGIGQFSGSLPTSPTSGSSGGKSSLSFILHRHVVSKTSIHDMAIDHTAKIAATACQDRNVRVYNTASGKLRRCYKGAPAEEGALLRVTLDSSATLLAAACSDKTVSILDFITGECLATIDGHSETVTGVRFTGDGKRLITTSADGCIFIWKLGADLLQYAHCRRIETHKRYRPRSEGGIMEEMLGEGSSGLGHDGSDGSFPVSPEHHVSPFPSPTPSPPISPTNPPVGFKNDFRFSVGKLPTWARKKLAGQEGGVPPSTALDFSREAGGARGQWPGSGASGETFRPAIQPNVTIVEDSDTGSQCTDDEGDAFYDDEVAFPHVSGNTMGSMDKTLTPGSDDGEFAEEDEVSSNILPHDLQTASNRQGPQLLDDLHLLPEEKPVYYRTESPHELMFQVQEKERHPDGSSVFSENTTTTGTSVESDGECTPSSSAPSTPRDSGVSLDQLLADARTSKTALVPNNQVFHQRRVHRSDRNSPKRTPPPGDSSGPASSSSGSGSHFHYRRLSGQKSGEGTVGSSPSGGSAETIRMGPKEASACAGETYGGTVDVAVREMFGRNKRRSPRSELRGEVSVRNSMDGRIERDVTADIAIGDGKQTGSSRFSLDERSMRRSPHDRSPLADPDRSSTSPARGAAMKKGSQRSDNINGSAISVSAVPLPASRSLGRGPRGAQGTHSPSSGSDEILVAEVDGEFYNLPARLLREAGGSEPAGDPLPVSSNFHSSGYDGSVDKDDSTDGDRGFNKHGVSVKSPSLPCEAFEDHHLGALEHGESPSRNREQVGEHVELLGELAGGHENGIESKAEAPVSPENLDRLLRKAQQIETSRAVSEACQNLNAAVAQISEAFKQLKVSEGDDEGRSSSAADVMLRESAADAMLMESASSAVRKLSQYLPESEALAPLVHQYSEALLKTIQEHLRKGNL